jgi:hypothetical protein
LNLIEAEIGDDVEKTDYRDRETVLPKTLNSQNPGSVKGKKKANILLKT